MENAARKQIAMSYQRASAADLAGARCLQERHSDQELFKALLKRGEETIPEIIRLVEAEQSWPQIHDALFL